MVGVSGVKGVGIPSMETKPAWIAVTRGSLGFAAVSVAAFAVWAFAGRRFGGEMGLYVAIAVVFLAVSGLVLHPLAPEPRLRRFYLSFVPAFFVYAAVWCAAWFALRFGWGEWLGSFAGSAAFALVLGATLKSLRPVIKVTLVIFVVHSAGYFLGGEVYYPMGDATGKLLWGLLYGLGFGAGIGYAYFAFQSKLK